MYSGKIKSIDGWELSPQCSWDDYAKPGDLVDESVYDYFLNILPPRSMGYGYLQVGEPYSHRFNPRTDRFEATYATFVGAEKGKYRYCGNCFVGQTDNVE